MGRRLLINGVDRWEDCVERDLTIEAQLTYQIDTCKFKLRGDQPHEGDEIIVEDDVIGRLFAGIIVKVSLYERTPDGSTSIWNVDSGDYTVQIDRKLVVETYENTPADVIFRDIVAKYCQEFTTNGVRSGAPTVEKIIFNYLKPSECFKQLCEYIGWQWDVSYYKDLSFFSLNDLIYPAPMKLVPGGQFYGLKHSIDQTAIKNRIYVLGGTMLSDPWTYELKADGTARTWVLPHEPSELIVSVGGVQKTVGQENVDKEEDFDFLYNKQEKYVKCSSQTPTPAAGTTISFTYRYPIPVITQVDDEESQQKIAAIQGGDGVYEDQITDDSLITTEAAEAAGNAQLREYANPKVTGSFQTEVPGWFPGQLVDIDLPDRGIQDTFLIQKVTISPYTPEHWTYKVEYGGRLKGIDSFLQALVSAQQKKKLNDTSVINKVNTLKDTTSITDEIISTPRTPGWVVEQSLEIDITNFGLSFDGTSGYVDLGFSTNYTDAVTLECWVKKLSDVPSGKLYELISKRSYYATTYSDFPIALYIDQNQKVVFALSKGDDYNFDAVLVSSTMLQIGVWYHIAAVYTANGQCFLYVNGIQEATTTISFSISTNTRNWSIGRAIFENGGGTGNSYANIVIDDVRIWNASRAQSDIVNSMNQELTGNEPRLVGYWKFNEGTGDTAFDSTINKRIATLSGGVSWAHGTSLQQEFATIGDLFNIWQTDSSAWPKPQYQISIDGGQTWGNWIAVDPAQCGYIEVPHSCRIRVKANGPVKVRNWKKPWDETDTVCGFVVCA